MRPTTTRTLNAKEFADIKHTVAMRSSARRNLLADPGYAAPLPQEPSPLNASLDAVRQGMPSSTLRRTV